MEMEGIQKGFRKDRKFEMSLKEKLWMAGARKGNTVKKGKTEPREKSENELGE